MSRMTKYDWTVYSILRKLQGKPCAEAYRHKRNKQNAEYGIGGSEGNNEWQIVRDYGFGGALVKQFVAEEMSHEDKKRFEEENWIEVPFSPYDCTGKHFSSWMSFFDVPGGVWVYHRICVDV